jgi:hypothetical protein
MKCKWCLIEFDITSKPKGWAANHSRWCDSNPKHIEYKNKLRENVKNKNLVKLMSTARKLKGTTNQFTKAKLNGYSLTSKLKNKSNIILKGKKHSDVSKQNMRAGCLKSKHRRLRKGIILYNNIKLDSKWELELAKRLDNKNIKWIRPEPLEWIDSNNIKHNYFPDFYLIDYDLYLDPKNPHAYNVQKDKIDILKKTYKNIVIIQSFNECKFFEIKNYVNTNI